MSSGRPLRFPSSSHSPRLPLFTLNEQNNYVPLPHDHPLYAALSPSFRPSTGLLSADDTPWSLFLADLRSISWTTLKDLILRPLVTGLCFGMGSYASRYIVHYLMVNYSDYHQPPPSRQQQPTAQLTAGSGEAGAAAGGGGPDSAGQQAAAVATPEVMAETIAYHVGQDMGGGGGSDGGGSRVLSALLPRTDI